MAVHLCGHHPDAGANPRIRSNPYTTSLDATPTAEVSGEAAVALAGLSDDVTFGLLERLADAYLVARVPVTAREVRWRLHDLVREFGSGLVANDEQFIEEGESARERLLAFYTRSVGVADSRLRWRPGAPEPTQFRNHPQALAWLDQERAGLVAAVQWGREERHADTVLDLSMSLSMYFFRRRNIDDWTTVARTAHEVACQTGNHQRQAQASDALGYALRAAGLTEEAIKAHTSARDQYKAAQDRGGEADAWDNLGLALQQANRAEEAIDAHTRARDLYHALGHDDSEAGAWNNLGLALQQANRAEEAIDAHTRARDHCQATQDRLGEGRAWNNLGLALRMAGHVDEAIEAYSKDLEICREFEDWYGAGQTLANMAYAHLAARHPTEARTHYLQAADAYTRANAPAEAADAQSSADALT